MDTISFKGETFVKGSKIAEELGYTADYVGQLCRSGQVEGTLVGRSWYVSEKSIRAHKKTRYRSNQTKSANAVRKMVEDRTQTKPFSNNHFTTPIYETDDQPLIPSVSKYSEFTPKSVILEEEAKKTDENTVQMRHVVTIAPVAKAETKHHDVERSVSVRPQIHHTDLKKTITPTPATLQVTPQRPPQSKNAAVAVKLAPSPAYLRVLSSAVIAAGFLLAVALISFEQHTFVSRVMPLHTEYYFDFTGGMQAAVALWSTD